MATTPALQQSGEDSEYKPLESKALQKVVVAYSLQKHLRSLSFSRKGPH